MDRVQENFLKILKNGLYDKCEPADCNLADLAYHAKTHICVPLIYIGTKNIGYDLTDEWKKFVTVSTLRNQHNLQVQKNIIDKLNEHGIPCAVLKGSSVSVNYKTPMMRVLGDVDILVGEENYDKSIQILCGDEIDNDTYENHNFHYKYMAQGVAVEIHKYVTEYSSEKYGKTISKMMENALDNVVIKTIDEFNFPALSNEYQAACLLLHTQRHFFENRLPIRMLCDWLMYVKGTSLSEWKDKIYPFVSKMGLDKLCDTLTAVCNKYLDAECEDKVISSVDDEIIDSVMEEFLSGGIIKEEDSFSRNVGSYYSQNRTKAKGKILPFILVINQIARNEFKLANKPVFLPLFWIYIPLRYIFKILTGKRNKISFGSFDETATRKEKIINKLHLKD